MKKTLIGLSLVALAAGGVAIAQPMGGPGRDPMAGKTVTRAEAQTRAAEMFARMDANKDGKLDKAEWQARKGKRGHGGWKRDKDGRGRNGQGQGQDQDQDQN